MSDGKSIWGVRPVTTTGLLSIAFIVLKLIGVIDWPWVWVLSPVWIPLCIAALLVAFALFLKAARER